MLNLTAEAKQAWLAQTRQVNARVTIGTAVYNADKIMSIEYDSGSISGETFQIGSFYQNSIKVVLVGILESLANDNKVILEFAVKVGQAFEWVNMGTFYVTELDRDRNSNRTTFTAVDASVYLGKNYAPTISFPNSLKNLVTDIANQCGVQVNFASMAHLADVNVTQPPSKYTCRQVISMVAQIHGGFARINRNDQLEVTRLMSSDIELSPSHYLLKGLTKNETTYRTDGIIVKIGENEEDVLKVGTTTGSAVINLENPLMTQTLLDEMWRVVSIISYYPFNLKWRGIPNLEAGDWITIVDKQGTRYRVPNLSYKLSFKGGLSAESSANTTATSNVQHKLRGTLTQRVEDVEGYINATGGRSYTGLDVPDNKYLKKGDTWYKPDGDDTAILVYDGEKWEEVASPEVFRQLQADFEALDKQAKEAFEQVDTLVQESPETKRLAQEAQEAANLANKEITKLQTSVSDTKTALQNAEQEFADSLATTTRELTAKISGIDVGGRNYIRYADVDRISDSTNNRWWYYSCEGTRYSGTFNQSEKYLSIKTDISKSGGWGQWQQDLPNTDLAKLQIGEKVTFSCEVWIDDNTSSGYFLLDFRVNPTQNYNDFFTIKKYLPVQELTPNQWNKIYVSGEITQKYVDCINDLKVIRIIVSRNNATKNNEVRIRKIKGEKSTTPSDFSKAPEDFESDLSNTSIELSTKITESAAKLRTEMSEKYSTKNDLTTLQGEYNSFKEDTAKKFSQQVSSIQTIQTDTTEAQKLANDAYTKANSAATSATNASSTANSALDKASNATNVANSASQNANNAVASANSAVSTANTAKSNADKAIADVASLTKTVSSQSTRIDQTSSRIDQVASGVTEVGNKLSNLKIGSRNLWIINRMTGGIKETLPDNHITGQKECWRINNGSAIQFFIEPEFSKRMYGKTFTFSAWIKYENVVKGTNDWNVFNIFKHALQYKNSSSETITGIDYSTLGFTTGTSDWKKVTYTYTYDRSGFDMLKNSFRFNIEGAKSGTAWVTGIQIEEGNIVSDYHLSEEDAQGKLDDINNNIINNYYQKTTVDSKLSTAVSGITAQYTQDITTRLGNYYDKSTIDSKLTIDGQGISTYVKNTQSKLDNLQVGGTNLLRNTKDEHTVKIPSVSSYVEGRIFEIDTPTKNGEQYVLSFEAKASENGYIIQNHWYHGSYSGSQHPVIKAVDQDGNIQINEPGTDAPTFLTLTTEYKRYYIVFDVRDSIGKTKIIVGRLNDRRKLSNTGWVKIKEFKLEKGNTPTAWSPAIEDMATLTQYTEVKQLADQLSATVYDSASGLVTKTTQLAGKYAIQNLNSYGDVLSSLNLNGGNVRIKGGLIDLDGNVRIQDGFVNNLKTNSILAKEITAQATTVVNAKIANLDAGVITTGILKGTNLSLNLGTGEVQFQKGRIQAPNNTLDIQVNTGIMKVLNTNGEGVTFQNGNLYFSNARVQDYYGSLLYNSSIDGTVNGVRINGLGGVVLASKSQKDLLFNGSFVDIQNGASLSLIEHPDGKGYASLLSQDSIQIAVNKKREATFSYDFTGINIYKDTDSMKLRAGTMYIYGDILNFSGNTIYLYHKEIYSLANKVTFNNVVNFSGNVNFSQKVNDNYLALGKTSQITFDLKNAYTSSTYLEVTQGYATYKIPLQT